MMSEAKVIKNFKTRQKRRDSTYKAYNIKSLKMR